VLLPHTHHTTCSVVRAGVSMLCGTTDEIPLACNAPHRHSRASPARATSSASTRGPLRPVSDAEWRGGTVAQTTVCAPSQIMCSICHQHPCDMHIHVCTWRS